jgi:hypothetical protein
MMFTESNTQSATGMPPDMIDEPVVDFYPDEPPAIDAPVVDHALYYAQRGWHVFPVRLGTKISHKSAARRDGRKWGQTVDIAEIRRDFQTWPDANVGIACGTASEMFVVETDTADGHGDGIDGAAELAKLEAVHGMLPATLEAISPSGSVHRYYAHPGYKIKNSASEIGPGIDVRGDGGMVVAPPSIKPGKGVYSWRNELAVADAPQWLLDRILAGKAKPEKPEKPAAAADEPSISERAKATIRQPSSFAGMASQPWVDAVLRGEYEAVASAPKGKRNGQLNISSLKLGHYVGGGVIDQREAVDKMWEGCAANGLLADDGEEACQATIESGMMKGISEPKGIPERDNVLPFPGGADRDDTGEEEDDGFGPKQGDEDGGFGPKAKEQAKDDGFGPRAAPTGLPLTFFDDVESFAKKTWLLKGVIAKGETSMWIAPPGRLKSALMTDLAIHLASGTDWRGYLSKETCGVVYFALERGDLVKRRLAAHRKRNGLTGLPIAVAAGIINLMDPNCVDVIVATIRAAEKTFASSVGFAVFDTFAKGIAAGGGDENHAKDLGLALANLRRAQEQTGAHVAVVSHTGKDQKKGARGSNSQDGDVDVLVQIAGDGTVKIATVTKANDQAEGVLTKFKAEIAVLGVDEDGDDISTAIISADLCGSSTDGKSTGEKAPLRPTERRAMDLLINAINDVGTPPPPTAGIPTGIGRAVPVDVWSTYCERGGISAGEARSAFRMAFQRVRISLANKHRIGELDGLVWVAYD